MGGISISFINNSSNPQQVIMKGKTMTFQKGNTYHLSDPDLSNFITNTQIDREVQNIGLVINFLYDMKYNIINGDKESNRYVIIKHSYQPLLGSGLRNILCFFPADPDDRL